MKLLAIILSLLSFTSAAEAQSLNFQMQEAGRAWVWDDARSQCRALGESWDLPLIQEFLAIVMTGRGIKILRSEGGYIHPLWIRGNNEKENEFLKGTSKIFHMSDGRGYDVGILEHDAAYIETARQINDAFRNMSDEQLKESKWTDEARDAAVAAGDSLIEAYNGGFRVICVHP